MPNAYTFKYLRGDGEEIEKDSFLKLKKAKECKKKMVDAGAICSDIYPIEIDSRKIRILEEKEKSFVDGKVAIFEDYLDNELNILDSEGVTYQIVYNYIREFEPRLLRFIRENIPWWASDKSPLGLDKVKIRGYKKERKEYLKRISSILEDKANFYTPVMGSVPEDIGKLLRDLSIKVSIMK